MKILLVEDDQTTAKILAQELTTYHYTVETVADGSMGLELVQAIHYDLLLLDIILPNLDGISLCRQLRSLGLQIPILLLSAKENITKNCVSVILVRFSFVGKKKFRSLTL
jgi:DNA-binding response OmpR family regulator